MKAATLAKRIGIPVQGLSEWTDSEDANIEYSDEVSVQISGRHAIVNVIRSDGDSLEMQSGPERFITDELVKITSDVILVLADPDNFCHNVHRSNR